MVLLRSSLFLVGPFFLSCAVTIFLNVYVDRAWTPFLFAMALTFFIYKFLYEGVFRSETHAMLKRYKDKLLYHVPYHESGKTWCDCAADWNEKTTHEELDAGLDWVLGKRSLREITYKSEEVRARR